MPLYQGVPENRDAFWARLRRDYGEVAPVLLEPGVPAWLLLSYRANYRVMVEHQTFARDPREWRDLETGVIPQDSGVRAINEKRQSVLYSDDEEHRFLSKGLTAAFAALDQHRVAREITQVSEELIDGFCERGHAELIGEYARLLPLHVLCRLFGLDSEEVTGIAGHVEKLWEGGAEAPAAAAAIKVVLTDIARRARARPGDDLPSHLVAAGQSDDQICDQLTLIIAGTNDMVTHSIGAILRTLLIDERLASDHAHSQLLISETVNHVLMRATPVEVLVGRFPRHDVRIGNYEIRAGDCVVFGFAAANADLLDGASPDQARSTRAHLTFGTGVHRCPRYGRDLGLEMAEVATAAITHRLPDLALAEHPAEHRWIPHVNIRGLVDLKVRFTPVAPRQRSAESAQRRPAPHPQPNPAAPPPDPTAPSPSAVARGLRTLASKVRR
ncbi:cytochrome P450 [Lipingzhangella halophila]|uniref:cytochrome P450 n=1 Tax=Lipingzhangella halophila TaxID=1783352 RepID=UPI00161AAFB6|nr:cytochrome P450 [Lipingzhangella halophila]